MSTVFDGTIFHALKRTLNLVLADDTDNAKAKMGMPKWCEIKTQNDYYEDDLETAGPGLASEVTEGSELPTGTIREGYMVRYIARKFGQKIIATEEALEDNKYDKVIDAAKRLRRSMYKTIDMDATLMLVRCADTNYVYGDGLCLANSAHLLADGGTFSTILATPYSPSRAAVIAMTSQAMNMPGHDGVREGYELKTVVCPVAQWAVWEGLVKSTKAPEPGAFNEINVVNQMDLSIVPLKFWFNTTTNWGITTDADGGLNFRYRREPRSRSWVDNDAEVMKYGISARWSRGCSNARGILFSLA